MNYLKDIQPHEGDGVTDTDILAILQSQGITNYPINRANLVHVLNLRGMLQKLVHNNADEKWSGTVLNMQDMIISVGTEEQKAGIKLWLSHITNPTNQIWDTTQVEFAAPFWILYQTFKDMANMPTTADFQALADLGGGWKYADLTVEKIAELRTNYQNEQTSKTRINNLQVVMDQIENLRSAAIANEDDASTFRAAIRSAM